MAQAEDIAVASSASPPLSLSPSPVPPAAYLSVGTGVFTRAEVTNGVVVTDEAEPYVLYTVHLEHTLAAAPWTVNKRYSQFLELHTFLTRSFPAKSHVLDSAFPERTIFRSKVSQETIAARKELLSTYCALVLGDGHLCNVESVSLFFEVWPALRPPFSRPTKVVLFPLPNADFDPTEVAVPWKIFTLYGFECVFATEQGWKPAADSTVLLPGQTVFQFLEARPEAKAFYREMEVCEAFNRPIRWDAIDVTAYDCLYLGGGHAPGMKQYLESSVLQSKIIEFWQQESKLTAAICHGVLLLARCIHPITGLSLLHGRRTTSLTKTMERTAYFCTATWLGRRYRTYDRYCEDEIISFLQQPADFVPGPLSTSPGTLHDNSNAFTCVDGRYLSGRYPGDAYLLAKQVVNALLSR